MINIERPANCQGKRNQNDGHSQVPRIRGIQFLNKVHGIPSPNTVSGMKWNTIRNIRSRNNAINNVLSVVISSCLRARVGAGYSGRKMTTFIPSCCLQIRDIKINHILQYQISKYVSQQINIPRNKLLAGVTETPNKM